jgi:uncharacterized protein (DUF1810 family)
MNSDPFNLHRFITAQDAVMESVLTELRAGQKASHWMWFVFPQIQGLGSSSVAQRYAIACREEGRAYHKHLVLGTRLKVCTQLVLNIEGRSAKQIFGYPDDLKFRSCMTLFADLIPQELIYHDALQKYFAGDPDARTLQILSTCPNRLVSDNRL